MISSDARVYALLYSLTPEEARLALERRLRDAIERDQGNLGTLLRDLVPRTRLFDLFARPVEEDKESGNLLALLPPAGDFDAMAVVLWAECRHATRHDRLGAARLAARWLTDLGRFPMRLELAEDADGSTEPVPRSHAVACADMAACDQQKHQLFGRHYKAWAALPTDQARRRHIMTLPHWMRARIALLQKTTRAVDIKAA